MMEANATAAVAVAAPSIGGSPEVVSPPGKEQQVAGAGILLQISMLVLAFVLGHLLRRHKFYYLPEASASLLIGLPLATPLSHSRLMHRSRFLGDLHCVLSDR
uniref:Uncharacterized protein n=1 Tax=Ananas comosus var. bracteatus TaxID=296719 RepID=A0A6V7QRS7_ANACO